MNKVTSMPSQFFERLANFKSIFLAAFALTFMQLGMAQTTVNISGLQAARTFVDITPAGGFPAGATLTSLTLALTAFSNGASSTIVGDYAVVVAPATPTAVNPVFYTRNTGGFFTAGTNQAWQPSTNPILGTSTMTLATPLSLNGQRLFIGNAYVTSGTWTGTLQYATAGVAAATTPVPTLSEYAMMTLAALMAAMGAWQMRKRGLI